MSAQFVTITTNVTTCNKIFKKNSTCKKSYYETIFAKFKNDIRAT